ncbi:ABC transporter-like domain protein, partial [mine drainage metagenome]
PLVIDLRFVAPAGVVPISARIGPGEVLGLLGPSGSGRTALLEAIAGARRHLGEVLVNGRPRYPRQVALAPEEPEQVLFGQTARDAVSGDAGREMLQALGGTHLLDRDWLTLSSGERRRVALAAVLGLDRELLLFDKPTAGLDPEGAAAFWQALRERGRPAAV